MFVKFLIYSIFGFLVFSPAHCFFRATKEQAEKIKQQKELCLKIMTPTANALQSYYRKNRKFPQKLDELVPNYLAQIPVELTDAETRPDILKDIRFRYNDGYYFGYKDEQAFSKYKFSELPKEFDISWRQTTAAIENFRREKGFYPENLEKLVPEYLETHPDDWIRKSSLPEDLRFVQYHYYVIEEFGFESNDTPSGFDGCLWKVEKADWECEGWF